MICSDMVFFFAGIIGTLYTKHSRNKHNKKSIAIIKQDYVPYCILLQLQTHVWYLMKLIRDFQLLGVTSDSKRDS